MIKNFIMNGFTTLMGLLKLEWLNFKNWKNWTSLRMLYFMIAMYMMADMILVLCGGSMWYVMMYCAMCCFFKVEPIMWMLDKLGFSKTKI